MEILIQVMTFGLLLSGAVITSLFSGSQRTQFCVLLVISCLVADLLAEETTTENSSLSGNNTQDVYEINSVQFEIGVNENMESNATAEPITKDKLSETKVAFLVPPAALFNVTQPSTP